jgi:polysaccharide pyruvyl transferase WcaK-like protein
LGDAAIQESVIQNIRRRWPESEIVGFTLNPADTERRHGIRSFPISGLFNGLAPVDWTPVMEPQPSVRESSNAKPLSSRAKARLERIPILRKSVPFLRAGLVMPVRKVFDEWRLLVRGYQLMREFDILAVSGGGQLDDFWGGAWRHPYTLFKWAVMARLAKTRFVFLSVGVGSARTMRDVHKNVGVGFLSRFFIKWALRLASYRSYRDTGSKDIVVRLWGYSADPVFPDLAYGLVVSADADEALPDQCIAVSPIAYRHPDDTEWREKDPHAYWRYLSVLAHFVARLCAKGHEVVLFATNHHMDQRAIDDLATLVGNSHNRDTMRNITFAQVDTLVQLFGVLRRARVVVASRLHGVLLSTLVGTPVLAVSYERKVEQLMKDLGQSDFCVEIDDYTQRDLDHRMEQLLSAHDAVRQRLRSTVREFASSLDGQFDAVFGANSEH